MNDDERTVAASLLWLLRGDAGQRVLAAWSMGWQPAQLASGTSWMAPYLSLLLEDPYDAVRFVAQRSLRALPGFAGFTYDFVAPPRQQFADAVRAIEIWQRTRRLVDRRTDAELLFDTEGSPNMNVVNQLIRQRDGRPVLLRE